MVSRAPAPRRRRRPGSFSRRESSAAGGSNGGGGDDRDSLVHRFVYDQPPGLAPLPHRNGWEDQHVSDCVPGNHVLRRLVTRENDTILYAETFCLTIEP